MAESFDLQLPTTVPGLEDTHPAFDKVADQVQRCRDTVDGDDAIKAGGTKYLAALEGERPDEYKVRQGAAVVYDAADKTLDVFLGALFRKPPATQLPKAIEPHLESIDLAGMSYEEMRQTIASERLEAGRYGVLVDWSREQQRPFWVGFDHERIRNWAFRVIDGRKMLSLVVLFDPVAAPAANGFGEDVVDRYRVLRLDEKGELVVSVYTRETSDGAPNASPRKFTETTVRPTVQGVPWREIPFHVFPDITPSKPPLLAVANLQLDHYRLSVDQRQAQHTGAAGALFVIGDGDPDTPKDYVLGCRRANRIAAGADAKFIEYEGRVLASLATEKTALEQRMALIGARALSAPKREAETAEALGIQRESESATLSTISYGLSRGLTRCWQLHARWMGLNPAEVKEELNRDFAQHRLTPQEISALMEAVHSGLLSQESFLEAMFAGELARDPETERSRIETQGPLTKPTDASAELGDDDDETNAAA